MLDLIRAFNAWARGYIELFEEVASFFTLMFAFVLIASFALALVVFVVAGLGSTVYSWVYRRFHLSEHPDRWSVCFYDGYGNVIHELVPENVVPEEYAKEWLFRHRSWKKDSCAVLYRMYRETTVKRVGDGK